MPDTDFTPALEEVAKVNIQRAADKKALVEWAREPDDVEHYTLEWAMDWLNRRPLAAIMRICG